MSAPHAGAAPRVVLATRNAHKVGELRAVLADALGPAADLEALVGVDAFSGVPDVVESGTTFAENALLKARAVCAATGLPAVSDDSGLCVAVLGGAPGVFSARWAGRHGDDAANLRLLLDQLADVPDGARAAWFACAAALVLPDGTERVEQGRVDGVLEREPRGSGGFGYDPVLRPDGDVRTMAELTPAEKHAISHRGRAFRALAPALAPLLAR